MDLTRVSTAGLERLARHLAQRGPDGVLQAPELAALEVVSPSLLGARSDAALAAVTAVLAERSAHRRPRLDVVWTGPEAADSRARDTRVVVRELFQSARESVLVAGFRFDHAEEILEPLHRAMKERAVTAAFFVDLPSSLRVSEASDWFAREVWPFGGPLPRVFVDARAGTGTFASLHAKCVVVDGQRTLVTSANFTDRAQDRNIELGVLLEDPAFARVISAHWDACTRAGHFVALG